MPKPKSGSKPKAVKAAKPPKSVTLKEFVAGVKTEEELLREERRTRVLSGESTIVWGCMRWYSLARNWRSEHQKRMEKRILDPYVNPDTGCAYTNNTLRYREKFVVIKPIPTKWVNGKPIRETE
jgi:hypothetical protein